MVRFCKLKIFIWIFPYTIGVFGLRKINAKRLDLTMQSIAKCKGVFSIQVPFHGGTRLDGF